MTENIEPEAVAASGISRRTVTKAAAWAIPTIALATAVPAYAASQGVIELTGLGCKLPGNSNSTYKGYAFKLSVKNTTANNITVNIQSVVLGTTNLGSAAIVNLAGAPTVCPTFVNPFLLPAGADLPNLALVTQDAANSSNGTLTVTYTRSDIVGETFTVTAQVASAPPINGNSCPTSTFTVAQKTCLAASIGGAPPTRLNSTAYAIGDQVSFVGLSGSVYYMVAVVGGTTGANPPTVPVGTVNGTQIVDGSVTWEIFLQNPPLP